MEDQYMVVDINDRLAGSLRDVGHTMRHAAEGKGSQSRILMILLWKGSLTQCALTQRLGIQPGSVSEVLGKLETAGLIRRTTSVADKRTTDIVLTQKGRKEAETALERRQRRHERMFSCLSAEEKETLLVLLKKLSQDWEQRDKGRFCE